MGNKQNLLYIVIGGVILYALSLPAYKEVNLKKEEKQKYVDSIEKIESIEQKKNEILASMSKISAADLSKMKSMIPDTFSLTKFISDVDTVASKYGISLTNIIYKDIKATPTNTSIDSAPQEMPFKVSSVSFNFNAKYESMLSFMKDLESSLQIIDVKSINMISGSKGVDSYTVEVLTYSIK